MSEAPGPGAPSEASGRISYTDDLALRLSGDSSFRAVLFSALILGFNFLDHFIDPANAWRALVWRACTAMAILVVQAAWVLSRQKSYTLYRRLVLTHTFTVPFGMAGAVAQLDQGLVYGLANFIFIYIWIPSVLPSRRDALLGGLLSGGAILLVTALSGEHGLALGNIIGLVLLGIVLSMLTATKFEAALRRAWEQEQVAAREARTDMLTGLHNRRHFEEVALAEWGRCIRYGRSATLVLFDLDHFKRINDQHGHPAGDAVLRAIAALSREEIRDIDTLARIGGEEFVLLLPETDMAAALILAERLRGRILAEEIKLSKTMLQVSASFGIAPLVTPDKADWRHGLRRADTALYRAKANGRNRIELATQP